MVLHNQLTWRDGTMVADGNQCYPFWSGDLLSLPDTEHCLLYPRPMRRDCDRHFPNRSYSLQFRPGPQLGMDCLTETASLGDDISLDWIAIIY